MNDDRLNNLLNFIYTVSADFDSDLSESKAEGYVIVLEDVEINYRQLRKSLLKNFDKMPTPKQILNFINPDPELSVRQKASRVAAELKLAVRKYGYTTPWKEVRLHLSTPAQKVCLDVLGGWNSCCMYPFENSAGFAQIRDKCEPVLEAIDHIGEDKVFLDGTSSNSRINNLIGSLSSDRSLDGSLDSKNKETLKIDSKANKE